MDYYISRNGQQLGPYSLADLQRRFDAGEILPKDLARSEAMQDWITVQDVIGNIPVANPMSPPIYGQIPAYAVAGNPPLAAEPDSSTALPPNLNWVIVLVLSIVTFGVFLWIWMFVQAAYVRRLDRNSKAAIFYALGIGLSFLAGILAAQPATKEIDGLFKLAGIILIIAGHFSLRSSLEDHFTRVEPMHLQLSGVMTFFFNTIYFQYHLNSIRGWKLTGVPA